MKKGFTIVEFAIVLVLVGIIVKIGLNAILGSVSELKYFEEEEEITSMLETSVVRYISTSDGNILPDNDTFDNMSFAYIEHESNDDNNTNFVIDYFYDEKTKDICNHIETETSIIINDENGNAINTIENISFAIFSAGINGALETTINDDGDIVILGNNLSDDLLKYYTITTIREIIGCTSIGFIENKLPAFTQNSSELTSGLIIAESIGEQLDNLTWCYESDLGELDGSMGIYLNVYDVDGDFQPSIDIPLCSSSIGTKSMSINNYVKVENSSNGSSPTPVKAEAGAYRINVTVENKDRLSATEQFILQVQPN